MNVPLLLAAAGALFEGPFSQPIEIAQPIRLQMTPTIDGTIGVDEWDPLSADTYLQWEPGRIYVAGKVPEGKDLVLSIDGKGDGWLVGRDNIEYRISNRDGKATVTTRELDATAIRQPIWRNRDDFNIASEAVAVGDTVEAVCGDAGLGFLPTKSGKVMLRVDVVDSQSSQEPYIPRACTSVNFGDYRGMALPAAMESAVQSRSRSVIPGEEIWMRLNFKGNEDLGVKAVEMKSIGPAEPYANRMAVVFPNFDPKGRAFVDYSSKVDVAASLGYRVMRARLSFENGPDATVEVSYRIAPLMGFRLDKTEFDRLPDTNRIRLKYMLQMYTKQPADGIVRIEPPQGWQVVVGNGSKFSLLGNQSADVRNIELVVPADAHGTFPLRFTGETKTASATQVCWLTIR